MSILKNELCKLLTRRTMLILALLIVINPLLQLYTIRTPGEYGYSTEDYSRLYREVSTYAPGDMLAKLDAMADTDRYSEMFLSRRVREEAEACLTYDAYLTSIDDKVAEIEILQRFVGDSDGYSLKNAERTSEVYGKLRGTVTEVQDPMPLLNVTDNRLTDYLAIIMLFIIALNLVFYEKNEGRLSLLRTTANGRRKLMAAKVAVMFFSVLFVMETLYAANALVGRCLFGSIDLGSPIQSIYVYRTCPLRTSIGGFLALCLLTKTLTCFLLGVFFMLAGAVFDNIIFVFITSTSAVLLEVLLNAKIPGTHHLAFLKYINIAFGVKADTMFADYRNMNLFGSPVNVNLLCRIVWLILTVILVTAVVFCLDHPRETKASSAGGKSFLGRLECHTSVFRHESYKMLVPGKCLIVLVLACLFTMWWNPAEKIRFDSAEELYYKDYADRFYGPLDPDNLGRIEAEREKFERLFGEMAADVAEGKDGFYISLKYNEDLKRQEAFDRVTGHVAYLSSVEGGQMFFDKGYGILTSEANARNRDIMQAYVYVILLVAMTFGIFGLDHRNSEERILRSTYLGRGRLKGIKCILGLTCAVVAFSLVYLVFTLNIIGAYGTGGLRAPAASIEHLANIPDNISVLQYLLIIMLMRFVGGLLIVTAVAVLFKYLRNNISVIISCIVLFIIPLVLVSLRLPNTQYILFNPLLLGNVF